MESVFCRASLLQIKIRIVIVIRHSYEMKIRASPKLENISPFFKKKYTKYVNSTKYYLVCVVDMVACCGIIPHSPTVQKKSRCRRFDCGQRFERTSIDEDDFS